MGGEWEFARFVSRVKSMRLDLFAHSHAHARIAKCNTKPSDLRRAEKAKETAKKAKFSREIHFLPEMIL